MFYVIQSGEFFRERNYTKIFDALTRLGLEFEVVDLDKELKFQTTRKDVFAFGSIRMVRLAAQNDWNPGSFFGGNHDYEIYSKHYGVNLLNSDSEIFKFDDSLKWFPDEIKFIRPTKDSKIFTGRVFTKIKWEDLKDEIRARSKEISQDVLVQVSTPKKIYKEARIWVVDGKIVTSSYYKFGDYVTWEENVEPEGLEFAQKMIDLYQVAPAFVMDICLTPYRWQIVEINCINCSGFYEGDLQKILIALEDKFSPIE